MSDCWKKTGNHAEYCGRHGSEAGWPCAVAAAHEAMWEEIHREPPEWLRESIRDHKAGKVTERELIHPEGYDDGEPLKGLESDLDKAIEAVRANLPKDHIPHSDPEKERAALILLAVRTGALRPHTANCGCPEGKIGCDSNE